MATATEGLQHYIAKVGNNIDELMSMSDIDGVLVGGASLKPDGFARIANYQEV